MLRRTLIFSDFTSNFVETILFFENFICYKKICLKSLIEPYKKRFIYKALLLDLL